MPLHVVNGAILQCTCGAAPSQLVVLPTHREQIEHQYAANIMDCAPMVNIMPFGACAVTEAACVPATVPTWLPGAQTVTLDYQLALDDTCTLICAVGGVVSVAYAGQSTKTIP
jgi:hypothetical protein